MAQHSGTVADNCEKDKRYHFHGATNPVSLVRDGPEMISRAEGIYLYLSDGRRLMDVMSGYANVQLGYGNERICKIAFETMRQLSFCSSGQGHSHPWIAQLSAKLAGITPPQFDYFFFANSGSEAVESAIKIAIRYWRLRGKSAKRMIITRRPAYHGSTIFATWLSAIESIQAQFGQPFESMIHYADSTNRYRNDEGSSEEDFCGNLIRSLEKQVLEIGPEKVAAFVTEPIQGLVAPPDGYWKEVRRICDEYDILLIADEVVTGFGKTGTMFGFENYCFEPDLIVMAKGLSSGYFPISAVAVGSKTANELRHTDEVFLHAFTTGAHPVGAAIALECIALLEEHRLVDRVAREIGPYFAKRWNELGAIPCVRNQRTFGVLGAFDVDLSRNGRAASTTENDSFVQTFTRAAYQRGLLIRGCRMCLPLTITTDQIDQAMFILQESIGDALVY